MLGLRLDRSPAEAAAMTAGIVLSGVLSFELTNMRLSNFLGTGTHRPLAEPAIAYLVGTWLVYYGGHALFYRLGLHRVMRRRMGAEKAYSVYSTLLGIAFFNVIWCPVPFLAVFQGTIDVGVTLSQAFVASLTLMLGSFFIKMWATLHLGLDGYYYRDMFLEERREDGPIEAGPYALFSDPMYSVGYFPVYSGALYALSFEGLVVAVIFHMSILLFNAVVEKPFVVRMYGDAPQSTSPVTS